MGVYNSVLGLGRVVVASQLSNTNIYVAGPAARVALSGQEQRSFAKGIKENTVAIWANAPRVEKLAEQLAKTTQPL